MLSILMPVFLRPPSSLFLSPPPASPFPPSPLSSLFLPSSSATSPFSPPSSLPSQVLESGSSACLQHLLDCGGDANMADKQGCTSLHVAAQLGNVEAATLLLERDARIDAIEKVCDTCICVCVRALQSMAILLFCSHTEWLHGSAPGNTGRPLQDGGLSDKRWS